MHYNHKVQASRTLMSVDAAEWSISALTVSLDYSIKWTEWIAVILMLQRMRAVRPAS